MPTENQKVDWIEIVPGGSRGVFKKKGRGRAKKKMTLRDTPHVYVITQDGNAVGTEGEFHFYFKRNDRWLTILCDALEAGTMVRFDYDATEARMDSLPTEKKSDRHGSALRKFTITRDFFLATNIT
jgi:hypothetical protein